MNRRSDRAAADVQESTTGGATIRFAECHAHHGGEPGEAFRRQAGLGQIPPGVLGDVEHIDAAASSRSPGAVASAGLRGVAAQTHAADLAFAHLLPHGGYRATDFARHSARACAAADFAEIGNRTVRTNTT